jgi:hypothetical protein
MTSARALENEGRRLPGGLARPLSELARGIGPGNHKISPSSVAGVPGGNGEKVVLLAGQFQLSAGLVGGGAGGGSRLHPAAFGWP